MLGFVLGALFGATIATILVSACAAGGREDDALARRDVMIENGNGRVNMSQLARVKAARRSIERNGLFIG